MKKNYQSYTLEDFLSDQKFRDWVLKPTPVNKRFWEAYLDQNPEQRAMLLEARELLQSIDGFYQRAPTDAAALDAQFDEIEARADSRSATPIPTKVRKLRPYIRWAVAASIALLATMSAFWYLNQEQELVYATEYGEWKTVVLPDSSEVRLNANTELRLVGDWKEGEDRKVSMQGEAFFDIRKKPATGARFLVQADDVSVEVLGTSFNMFNRNNTTEVFLEEGKVKLNAGEEATYLEPGDFVAYSGVKKKIVESGKASDKLPSSWKEGTLIMEKKPVRGNPGQDRGDLRG